MSQKFVIVCPGYNNSKWYLKNLGSILSQKYDNYRVIYIDDCSTDGTGQLVEDYLKKHDSRGLVKLIRNERRVGALENIYNAVHSCQDDEIIATVDADDWLKHSQVLNVLNSVYSDPNIWVAWSNYQDSHGRPGCSKAIPENIIKSNSYRHSNWCTSHLRTFRSFVFKNIKKEDLLQNDGRYYQMAWDLSFQIPMIEMAQERTKFINQILYCYNTDNPINDDKVNRQLQINLEMEIRRKPKYNRLER